ncbi:MAG: hypothetical protein Q7V09_13610 [Hydrogenophaga sp.]|uniref:DUF6701 domain-containing protein n=1 Tax=Hydrogenophaga sp. TaxID=1904254 RepID=UPI00271D10FE|nr:DUF6701 domain-containing protein [Hydrogenophaga sp.]MDO9031469.1 hypothetical protein [Hydrogenophaga sp.]
MDTQPLSAHRLMKQAVQSLATLVLAWVALLCTVSSAHAVAYVFPGTLPAGCTGTGPAYSCSATVTLASADTVTINSPKPATITISGGLTVNAAQINSVGSAADLTITLTGTLSASAGAVVKANVTAGSVSSSGAVSYGGNLTTTGSGAVSLGAGTTVVGVLTTSTGAITLLTGTAVNYTTIGSISSGGTVTLNSYNSVLGNTTGYLISSAGHNDYGGNITSTTTYVSLGGNATVTGSITSQTYVDIGSSSSVGGSITSNSSYIDTGSSSSIAGSLTTQGASATYIDIHGNTTVGGSITSKTYISMISGSTVGGDMVAGSTITMGSGSSATSSCLRSTSSGAITIPSAASVGSACCGVAPACSSTCVSGSPKPPACAGSQVTATFQEGVNSYTGTEDTMLDPVNTTTNNGAATAHVLHDDNEHQILLRFNNIFGSGSSQVPLGATINSATLGVYVYDGDASESVQVYRMLAGWTEASTWSSLSSGVSRNDVEASSAQLAAVADTGATGFQNLTVTSAVAAWSAGATNNGFLIRGDDAAWGIYTSEYATAANRPKLTVVYTMPASGVASYTVVPATTTPSTCSAVTITITARTSAPATYTGYTGTINLSTSTGKGDWALGATPTPSGILNNGTANDGAATYTFVAGDSGVVKLTLTNTQANSLTITAVDSVIAASSTTSASLTFSDNAFVLAEDLSSRISGSDVVIAGRNHDFQVTAIKKDPGTGACGTATTYTGAKTLKMWRTDSGSSWTAPTVVSPALTIPTAVPGASNLSLTFTSGVATFNLGTTDIGRYSLTLRDATGGFATGNIDGSSGTLTVRPFSVVVSGISQGATSNPNGSAAGDTVFAKAGSSFQATVAGYRWSSTADTNVASGDGVPDAGATLAQTTAGGVAPSFASTVTLSPVAASQTPATGVLGTLSNGTVSSFTSGSSTPATLQYSEVGSFLLNTSSVVSNFIDSGLSLDATVFNAAGAQNARIGRFKPSHFVLSSPSTTHRSAMACTPASTFTYQGELFQLGFTLTAQNANNATTANYTGTFAKLDPTTPANFALTGVAGTLPLRTTGGTPRLSLGTSTGSWSNGVATDITLTALVTRAAAAEAVLSASLGVAPQDSDSTVLSSFNLDSSYPADSTDAGLIGTLDIRFGRLRLTPAIGPQDRDLPLPLAVQYWDGSSFVTNALDSCTRIASTGVNFGQYRRTITAADTSLKTSPVTLSAGTGTLWLNKPSGGRAGTYDVTLSLGSTATDASCLTSLGSGVGDSATVGANLAYLRGAWCGATYDKDPSARATFGLFRGAQHVIHQQENY